MGNLEQMLDVLVPKPAYLGYGFEEMNKIAYEYYFLDKIQGFDFTSLLVGGDWKRYNTKVLSPYSTLAAR